MKTWTISILVLVIIILFFALILQRFWYVGFTEMQTAKVLLEDQKFGFRAYEKAKKYGSHIIDDFAKLTNDFESVNYYQAKTITHFLTDIEVQGLDSYGEYLIKKESLYPKLLGALIISKNSIKYDGVMFRFLSDVATRKTKGIEKNLIKIRDYYSEIAILGIGYLHNEASFDVLKQILNERNVPYQRHAATCQSLVILKDGRAIKLLRSSILDKSFYAILPAYKALESLGDKEAKLFAKKRIEMGLQGDEVLLRKHIEM